MKKKTETCLWKMDEFGDYTSQCGQSFAFDGWEVDTNAYKFCPGCGRKIEVKE